MSYDTDPPTRRLAPNEPPAVVPVNVRETEHVVAEDPLWREQLLDSVRSLRTGLVLVGLLAAAALTLSLFTLLTDEDRTDGDGRRGASAGRVAGIDDRVDRLESEIDDRATKSSVSSLRSAQQELESKVEDASAQAAESDGGTEAAEALQDDVQALGQRLDDLEQDVATAQEGADTP